MNSILLEKLQKRECYILGISKQNLEERTYIIIYVY